MRDWTGTGGGPAFSGDDRDAITHEVANAAYTVIRGKGATNSAIGLGGARIVEAVLADEHAVLPVSTVLGGLHGIDGIALSVPSLVGGDGAFPLQGVPFSPDEEALLRASADAIRRRRRRSAAEGGMPRERGVRRVAAGRKRSEP